MWLNDVKSRVTIKQLCDYIVSLEAETFICVLLPFFWRGKWKEVRNGVKEFQGDIEMRIRRDTKIKLNEFGYLIEPYYISIQTWTKNSTFGSFLNKFSSDMNRKSSLLVIFEQIYSRHEPAI